MIKMMNMIDLMPYMTDISALDDRQWLFLTIFDGFFANHTSLSGRSNRKPMQFHSTILRLISDPWTPMGAPL